MCFLLNKWKGQKLDSLNSLTTHRLFVNARHLSGCYCSRKGYDTTAQLGIRLFRNSAATSALGLPTSLDLQESAFTIVILVAPIHFGENASLNTVRQDNLLIISTVRTTPIISLMSFTQTSDIRQFSI